MTGPTEETWGEYGGAVLGRLSPKVVIPFVVALAGTLIYALIEGEFDTPQIVALITTFVVGVLGVAAPPAPAVSQSEVAAYSKAKRARRSVR
jgi:hypothetical protein